MHAEEPPEGRDAAPSASVESSHLTPILTDAILRYASDAIVVVDERQHIILFNQRSEELFLLSAADALGLPLSVLLPERYQPHHEDHVVQFQRDGETRRPMGERIDVFAQRADGTEFPAEVTIAKVEADGRVLMTALLRDTSERRLAEERREEALEAAILAERAREAISEELFQACAELELQRNAYARQASHDPLTGLGNRALLHERLQHDLAQASQQAESGALLFIDLDRFKFINDSLGHDVGDRLLQSVATRLKSCVRAGDTVARLGGDEFTILLSSPASASDGIAVARNVLTELARPHRFGAHELHVEASVGVSLYPDDGDTAHSLMRAADVAMYAAKAAGRNTFRVHREEMSSVTVAHLGAEQQLRAALREDRFRVHFQPVVELESLRTVSAEALLRMVDSTGNVHGAGDFLSAAEESGVIIPLGTWAIQEALAQAKTWLAEDQDLHIAVNVSARQFQQEDIVDLLVAAAARAGVPPRCVEVELTEEAIAGPIERVISTMESLRGHGFHLAIDDFGVGYSSLQYLARLPVETVKIDKSFIGGVPHNPRSVAIVEAMVALGHRLGFRVVAEGIERHEQLVHLQQIGCDLGQGFLFAAALPCDEFLQLIEPGQPLYARAA